MCILDPLHDMEKIRFGVVGTNFITDWVINGARQDSRFALTAVCSRSMDTAQAFAVRHGIPHLFTSLEEMASSPEVDAVYIATPNFRHADQSILCMEHGKHVLCEKPLASNAVEARKMIETAERHGVVLMEAMKPVMTPNFTAVREAVGRIGKVRDARFRNFDAGDLDARLDLLFQNLRNFHRRAAQRFFVPVFSIVLQELVATAFVGSLRTAVIRISLCHYGRQATVDSGE